MCTNCPNCAKSWHTNVKWCLSSSLRMARIRSIPSWFPSWHPSAKQESVGYAINPPSRTRSTTCPTARFCGFSGCTSKYLAIPREPSALSLFRQADGCGSDDEVVLVAAAAGVVVAGARDQDQAVVARLIEGAAASCQRILRHRHDRADPVRLDVAVSPQYDGLTRPDAQEPDEEAESFGLGVDVAGQDHRAERVARLRAAVPPADAIRSHRYLELAVDRAGGKDGCPGAAGKHDLGRYEADALTERRRPDLARLRCGRRTRRRARGEQRREPSRGGRRHPDCGAVVRARHSDARLRGAPLQARAAQRQSKKESPQRRATFLTVTPAASNPANAITNKRPADELCVWFSSAACPPVPVFTSPGLPEPLWGSLIVPSATFIVFVFGSPIAKTRVRYPALAGKSSGPRTTGDVAPAGTISTE